MQKGTTLVERVVICSYHPEYLFHAGHSTKGQAMDQALNLYAALTGLSTNETCYNEFYQKIFETRTPRVLNMPHHVKILQSSRKLAIKLHA